MNMNYLESVLKEILQEGNLTTVFQPIVDAGQQRIFAYEALVRGPSNSPLHNPSTLFEVAEHTEQLQRLEKLCHLTSTRQFTQQNLPGKLFLNTSPYGLLQSSTQTEDYLDKLGISPSMIVIELTERHPHEDYSILRQAIDHYRSKGFEIAIDDLGAGYSGLRLWAELRPDYVKIDKHFIHGIHEDPIKREFIHSIRDISHNLNCKVIAEGIETEAEFEVIRNIGINLCQGYYFARPHARPASLLDDSLFRGNQAGPNQRMARLSQSINTLLRENMTALPNICMKEVINIFCENKILTTLPVIDNEQRPIGSISRNTILEMFINPYSHALHGKRPLSDYMDRNLLMIDISMMVEEASKVITDNSRMGIEDDFIITSEGTYKGIGKVVDLLKKITDLQIRNARYANPLTMLPGNVPIYEMIDQLLEEKEPFCIAYCDLDNFKPFNDCYGYKQGDEIIKKSAELFLENIDPRADFIGHVGGDDFIIIFRSPDWERRCNKILKQFPQRIEEFYNEEDRRRGGIVAPDRQGQPRFYNMLSLSIGVAVPGLDRCSTHHDVAHLASEAKKGAKALAGNRLFVERRQGPAPAGIEYFLTIEGNTNTNPALQPSAMGLPHHKHA